MKKSVLMGIGLTLTVLCLAMLIAPSQATVYSGTGTTPLMYPVGRVYLTINTGTYSGKISWQFPFVIVTPLPGGWVRTTWQVWDDKGFSVSGTGKGSGSVAFWYPNKNTWVHAKATGFYTGAFWIVYDTARVDIYIGN